MDQEKMGRFICEIRKSQGLTQKELAEKLQVTDKAVSKWERGISCPDVSLLMPLSKVLEVSVGELLNGERVGNVEEIKENVVEETLRYSEKNTALRIDRIKGILWMLLTVSFLIALGACLICDLCIVSGLDWSLIVAVSLAFSWILLLPPFWAKEKMIKKTLFVLSLSIIPYLAILALLLKVPEILQLGSWISVISIIGLWCIYGGFVKLPRGKLQVAAALLVMTVMTWLINYAIIYFDETLYRAENAWINGITSTLMVLTAFGCLMGDFLSNRKTDRKTNV